MGLVSLNFGGIFTVYIYICIFFIFFKSVLYYSVMWGKHWLNVKQKKEIDQGKEWGERKSMFIVFMSHLSFSASPGSKMFGKPNYEEFRGPKKLFMQISLPGCLI